MKNVLILLILLIFISYSQQASPNDMPDILNNCNTSHFVVAKFVLPDVQNLQKLGFSLFKADTINDTGTLVSYDKEKNLYYVCKYDEPTHLYDKDIYKFVGYECVPR